MARTADHDARRRGVAEALIAVVARRGLGEASLAVVAEEAGVSVGLIQRYFRSRRELLRFAFEYLELRAHERLADVVRGDRDVPQVAYLMLETLLPLDEERLAESAVWVAFLAAGVVDEELLAPHQRGMREMDEAIASGIRQSVAAGSSPDHLDADFEARILTALVDGLVIDLVTNRQYVTPADARRVLAVAVDRAFGLEVTR
ncbi:TetR family transcriptional regulator C-terminal domain-containing protein [Kribbella sp. NBC_01505]|uniref:TetR/AcrR family transcriptional regulator n=1 Tax=Kribbella sp. NBC_01505 TaxID=2903580 RepID=UPI00386F5D88